MKHILLSNTIILRKRHIRAFDPLIAIHTSNDKFSHHTLTGFFVKMTILHFSISTFYSYNFLSNV